VDSEAWRLVGPCKLCLVSTHSYVRIYRAPLHPSIAATRETLLEGITKKNSALTGNEALPVATFLQLYHEVHGYRIPLGDPKIHHRVQLLPIYQNLPSPTLRGADALFLRLVRQFNEFRAGNWAERSHFLDPSVR